MAKTREILRNRPLTSGFCWRAVRAWRFYAPLTMKHELNDSHLTRCVDLEAMLTEASTEDIGPVLFENLTLEGGSYPGLTFRGCKFVGCRLSGCFRWNARRGLTACWSNATYPTRR